MPRTDLTFTSGDAECAAWLYRPEAAINGAPAQTAGGGGRVPLLVMAHGFSATREQRLDAFAERFCAAGLGVLLFDYRHFGASGGEPRQLLDVPSQLADFRAAIVCARARDWVDPERIVLFGSSFSGGHVLALAAQDLRIAAVVSQCPYTDSLASLPKLGVSNVLRITVHGMRDELRALRGREPHYVPAVAAGGRFGIINTPDAEPGFASVTPPQTNWQNRVAARIGTRITFYRPGRAAARIQAPLLVCVCERDAICPPGPTIKHATRAPRGEIRRYPYEHFEIYTGDAFEEVVADELAFLRRHLGLSEAAATTPMLRAGGRVTRATTAPAVP